MALWVCEKCSTRYAVGLEACPHCGSRNHHEEGTTPARPKPSPKPKDK